MSPFCQEHTANYKAQQWSGEVLYPPQRPETMENCKYPSAWSDFEEKKKKKLTFQRSETKYAFMCVAPNWWTRNWRVQFPVAHVPE